jgi:branched-chain amino acid transport system substrate-binding protein
MWDGCEFCARVRTDGSVAVMESGVRSSATDTGQLGFYWTATGGPLCRVQLEVTDGVAMLAGEPVHELPYRLSRRELDVLSLMVAGLTNSEIARRLVLSTRTVSTHVDRVLRKVGAPGRTAAAVRALDEGLVGVPIAGGADSFELLRLGRAVAAAGVGPGAAAGVGPVDGAVGSGAVGSGAVGSGAAGVPAAVPPRRGAGARRRIRRRPLVIGAALPLTGGASGDGTEMVRGAQLAIEELNGAGGVHGRMLALRSVDVDINSAAAVRSGLARLVDSEVDVLTSGYLAHQDVAHEFAAESGLPYLHAATMGAMEARVAGDPGRYGRIFQVCPSDVHYAPRFVDFVGDLRLHRSWHPPSKTLMVVQQAAWRLIDFGIEQAAAHAQAAGWELSVLSVDAGAGRAGWAEAAARVAGAEPAAVMLGSYFVEDQVEFVRRFRQAPSRTLLYSIYAPSVPEFRGNLGGWSDGVLWATTTGTYADQLGLAFADRYAQRFGEPPGRSHAGIAYDRVRLIAQAWARTEDFRNFASVANALRSTPHRGVNGSYFFESPGQTALSYSDSSTDPSLAQAHLVYQIQHGRQVIVSPMPYSNGSFRLPSWLAGA